MTDTAKNKRHVSSGTGLGAAALSSDAAKDRLGKRLGMLARGVLYGQTGFVYEHPRPRGCFKRGTTIVIHPGNRVEIDGFGNIHIHLKA